MNEETWGVRARLAWYWRRVQGKPVTLSAERDGAWWTAVVDPRPPWCRRRPQEWRGWQQIGATSDE